MQTGPIGVFDSGYGGLTVLKSLARALPAYDFIYLGDNARAPYGTRSYETVYQYTKSCVDWFFKQGCPLVILACNTASAKALRTIQQHDLHQYGSEKRVLGVIRPTAEIIGNYSQSGHIGILATPGTVASNSYRMEIEKFFPAALVTQQSCPLWVPLIENNEHHSSGATYFIHDCVQKLLQQDDKIDTVLLGCTHYPIIANQIKAALPPHVRIITQGDIVADSLKDYLQRHSDMDTLLNKSAKLSFYTTDDTADFNAHAPMFFGKAINAHQAIISLA
jgi:glutamate racemase